MNGVAKVLIVDDSAYVRRMFSQIVSRSPFLEVVGTARDGAEALEMAEQHQPDVITCDLNMPKMNGVAFVEAQMARRPVPIVIITVANKTAEEVLAALDAGAIDFVQKPTALASDRLSEVADELIEKVKVAANARLDRLAPVTLPATSARLPIESVQGHGVDVVVIGASTGGPQALRAIIPRLPADLPVAVAVVLHMPVGYTAMYAARLDELSALKVKEAAEGDIVEPGVVLLAPAGRHLTFKRMGEHVVTHLDLRPLDTLHRPAVDVLFESAAQVYGARTLGVVMTGMGTDGRDGAAWIKACGGQVISEAEASCVVYGMPRAVAEAGLSDASVSLEQMAEAMLERL